jgi:hypothetical protein
LGRQGDLFGQPPGHSAALALFEQWYQHYPRKIAKLQAQRTWLQIRPLPDHAFTTRAIEAIERQKRDPEFWQEGGRYIPHPSTWLNAGRYLDEEIEVPPAMKWAGRYSKEPWGIHCERRGHDPPCLTQEQCRNRRLGGY